jgi:hypothetical protein
MRHLLVPLHNNMDTSALEAAFLASHEEVGRKGDVVRSLKAQVKDGQVEKVRQWR